MVFQTYNNNFTQFIRHINYLLRLLPHLLMTETPCARCKYIMYNSNAQYYCCNINQRYCTICRGQPCIRCTRPVDRPYQAPKCRVCFSVSSEQLLIQPICSAYYCAKCLVTQFISPGRDCQLPCGHKMNAQNVQNFIKGKFCVVCGKKCHSNSADYDLITGDRCCVECFRFERKKIQHLMLVCLSCERLIIRKSQVGVFNEGIILCQNCAKLSRTTEKQYQKKQSQKKIDNSRPSMSPKKQQSPTKNNYMVQRQVKNIPQQFNKMNISPPLNQLAADLNQQGYHITVNSPPPNKNKPRDKTPTNKRDKTPTNHLNNTPNRNVPMNNVDYNPWVNDQFKLTQHKKQTEEKKTASIPKISPKEQQKRSPNGSPNGSPQGSPNKSKEPETFKRTVLHRFPSEKEEEKKRGIKKHMSMETFIERLQIQIPVLYQNSKFVTCKECQYELIEEESFTIQNSMHQIDNYCRLCYTVLTNSQGLGFNMAQGSLDRSRNTRGLSSTKDNAPPNQYNSSHKPHQHQQKQQNFMIPAQNQFVNKSQEPNVYNYQAMSPSPYKKTDNYQRIQANVRAHDPKTLYRDECQKCKVSGVTLIRTTDRGAICLSCYKN